MGPITLLMSLPGQLFYVDVIHSVFISLKQCTSWKNINHLYSAFLEGSHPVLWHNKGQYTIIHSKMAVSTYKFWCHGYLYWGDVHIIITDDSHFCTSGRWRRELANVIGFYQGVQSGRARCKVWVSLLQDKITLLPPANEVWGKVIFSQACVSHSVHRRVPVWCHFLSGCLVPCSLWGSVSVQRGLCPGALCPGGLCSLSRGSLSGRPPRQRTPVCWRVGSMHPTGMLSSFTVFFHQKLIWYTAYVMNKVHA